MRLTLRHNIGTKLSFKEIHSTINPLGYIKDEINTTKEVYYFRNGPYHLKISPKKSRLEFAMHKDHTNYFRAHSIVNTGRDIEKQFKKVKKVLEDMIDV